MEIRPTTQAGTQVGTTASRSNQSASTGGGGTCAPACSGQTDATSGANALRSALDRLAAAVEQLRQAVARLGSAAGGGGSMVQQSSKGSPIQGGGPAPASATSRTSAIPQLQPGQTEQVGLARNQVTYRRVTVSGGATGTTFTPPAAPAGMTLEVYALRDHQRGAHSTQVLEPVNGTITIPPGEDVQLVVRMRGEQAGSHTIDIAGARLDVDVSATAIESLPMMAWVNESNAQQRGANGTTVSGVLSHFGVSATGNSGISSPSQSNRSPVQYFSAAYEAANRLSPAETARRIVEAERKAGAANPGSTFWVQVSDEQDKDAASAQQTTQWIADLRRHLDAYGSRSKLFVAAQARPHNLVYASVIDGWATTQSAAGRDRETAIADIRRAAQQSGRSIELMEYPGNAFFDARTPGSAAVSTASAALDGASSWFIYSSNNQDVLERGSGDEGHGDIGGLVVVDGGRVLPTIALIEAELGANLGAAARTFGATATSGAQQIAYTSDRLDAYRHTGQSVDLRLWEQQIAQLMR